MHWFVSPAKDTRSSLYVEDAVKEFQVQGLELDWTIVTRDADLPWSAATQLQPEQAALAWASADARRC